MTTLRPMGLVRHCRHFANATLAHSAFIGGLPQPSPSLDWCQGFVGLGQANILVPNASPGERPLSITIGGVASNSTLVSIAARQLRCGAAFHFQAAGKIACPTWTLFNSADGRQRQCSKKGKMLVSRIRSLCPLMRGCKYAVDRRHDQLPASQSNYSATRQRIERGGRRLSRGAD